MAATHIEVLVEEPSMEWALRALLPRIVGTVDFAIYPHQGKDALLRRLPARLAGYRRWLPSDWFILIVVDRDDDNCTELKNRIEAIARAAGLRTRASHPAGQVRVLTRIAIEELESWYFGDWKAVREAYPRVSARVDVQARYRVPDAISHTWEVFERLMNRAGYFTGGLRKIEAARQIAPRMDPARNTSRSFRILRQALVDICAP